MGYAFERREQFTKDGKCIMRETCIGSVVVYAVIIIVTIVISVYFHMPELLGNALSFGKWISTK